MPLGNRPLSPIAPPKALAHGVCSLLSVLLPSTPTCSIQGLTGLAFCLLWPQCPQIEQLTVPLGLRHVHAQSQSDP